MPALTRQRLLIGAPLLSLGVLSCDSGVSSDTLACHVYCEKLEVCDDASNVLGCEQLCTQQRFRSTVFLEVQAQCIEKLSCNLFAGEVGPKGEDRCSAASQCNLRRCEEQAFAFQKLGVDPGPLCTNAVSKLVACDHTLDSISLQTRCVDLAPTLSSAYLQASIICVEGRCGDLVSCLQKQRRLFETDLLLYPNLPVQ